MLRGGVAIALGDISTMSVADILEELVKGDGHYTATTSGVLINISLGSMVLSRPS